MKDDIQKWEITFDSWIRCAVVVIIVYALYLVSDFILIIISSIVIASAIEPAVAVAKKPNIPPFPGVLSVYFISAFVFCGFFFFLLPPLAGEISSFIRTL